MWETSQNFSVIRNLSHVAELISHQLQATINNGSIPPVPEPELPPNGPVVESSNSSQSGKSRPIPEGEPNPEGEPRGDNKAPNVEPHSERPKNGRKQRTDLARLSFILDYFCSFEQPYGLY